MLVVAFQASSTDMESGINSRKPFVELVTRTFILCAIDARRNENADFVSSFSPEDKHLMSALVGGTVMNHIGFDYN